MKAVEEAEHGVVRFRVRPAIAVLLAVIFPVITEAKIHRSRAAVAESKRHHTCPSTGKTRGACPGYVIDHIYPLCAGGEDHPGNMQYQEINKAKDKDRWERSICTKKNRP